mmetsp:Transcript_56629/g.115952  ORF Transcript_56629/g.115952 Transcript_56629/m.115952 type:complete len:231 (+) Transcript_56629:4701-5393(+)
MVKLLRFTLIRSGITMISPCSDSSIRASPTTSRFESGGITISSSIGYCETHEREAPRSTCPTSISKMVGRPSSCPLYWIATSRLIVVDIRANSTPPLQPYLSSFQNLSGSSMPPSPRKTLRSCGSFQMRDSFSTALTTAWIVVTYPLPFRAFTPASGALRSFALYFMNMGPVKRRKAMISAFSSLACLAVSCLRKMSRSSGLRSMPGYCFEGTGLFTNSHSSAGCVSVPP